MEMGPQKEKTMCEQEVLAKKIVRLVRDYAIDDNGDLNEEHAVSLVNAVLEEFNECQVSIQSIDTYARFAEPNSPRHTLHQKSF
jgi:hypothetical protein